MWRAFDYCLLKPQQRCCNCGDLCWDNQTLQFSPQQACARISPSHIRLPSAMTETAVLEWAGLTSHCRIGHPVSEDLKLSMAEIRKNTAAKKPLGYQSSLYHSLPKITQPQRFSWCSNQLVIIIINQHWNCEIYPTR